MNFQIRECKIIDSKAIYDLNIKEMKYDYPEDRTKEKINELLKSDKDKILVALVDNFVVGYVHANDYDVLYAPNIMGIAVSNSFKKGIAKALLIEIEDWARKTGACGICLVRFNKNRCT